MITCGRSWQSAPVIRSAAGAVYCVVLLLYGFLCFSQLMVHCDEPPIWLTRRVNGLDSRPAGAGGCSAGWEVRRRGPPEGGAGVCWPGPPRRPDTAWRVRRRTQRSPRDHRTMTVVARSCQTTWSRRSWPDRIGQDQTGPDRQDRAGRGGSGLIIDSSGAVLPVTGDRRIAGSAAASGGRLTVPVRLCRI